MPDRGHCLELTDEEKMLVTIRDELYAGDWDEFLADLQARMEGRPYVFEIGPPNARLKDTIQLHVRLIHDLRRREQELDGDLGAAGKIADDAS
jgi:hypothetical protein